MYRPGIGEVELPNEIERALDEQRLVLFCGAGISVYTGLPLFKGLVENVFRRTYRPVSELSGDDLEPAQTAFNASQYDRALGLLEQTLVPGSVRRAVIEELSRPYIEKLRLHEALLELARVPDGGYHLVTTNFDARFEKAGLKEQWIHDAPRLAPPRPRDWHHATYIHGRIKDNDPSGRQLVLTSADFGRAYLHDGWAARFVVELFREFTVLFVGYSVEDPVMSYLVDALASHRQHSQQFRTAFALVGFDSCAPGDQAIQERTWQAKNIEPITFPKSAPDDYSAMDQALVAWADDRRLGLESRINIALRATNRAYLQRDREAEQVVWALSQHDGSVAEAFAGADPPADASWLRAFEEIDVPQADGRQAKLTSFAPDPRKDRLGQANHAHPLAGRAQPVFVSLSLVTHQIGVWITKHLDDQRVVDWAARHGGILNAEFAGIIAWRLGQQNHQIDDLYRKFWNVVLIIISRHNSEVLNIVRVSNTDPSDSDLRREMIVEALKPIPTIELRFGSWIDEEPSQPKMLRHLARIEVSLLDRDGMIVDRNSITERDLLIVADEFTSLLAETIELGRIVELIEMSGHSDWTIRSVADPAPDDHPERWTILVTLARDAFMALRKHDRMAARALFGRWMTLARRPGARLFLRLALFAATQAEHLPLDGLIRALLAHDADALWEAESNAEVAAFLQGRGSAIEASGMLDDLFGAIRKGPADTASDLDPELGRKMVAGRLESLTASGLDLPSDLAQTLRTWFDDQSEYEGATVAAPTIEQLVSRSDDPTEVARLLATSGDSQPQRWWFDFSAYDVLSIWLESHLNKATDLFNELVVIDERGEGLAGQVLRWLGDRDYHDKARACLSSLVSSGKQRLGDHLNSYVGRALMALAEDTSEGLDAPEFWRIWSFAVHAAAASSGPAELHEDDPLTDSLNHPGGYLAQALLFKARHEQEAGELSKEELTQRLHALADGDRDFHFLARTMLASRLPWLHALDRQWATDALIDRMGWHGDAPTSDARGLWQGYLWAPSLNPSLLEDLKPAFLQALTCDLSFRGDDNLFQLFADLLLKAPEKISPHAQQRVFRGMPVDGLVACARYWQRILQGSGSGAASTWRDKIGPAIEAHWPVVGAKVTPKTVEALARLAAAVMKAFPEAFNTLSKKGLFAPLARSGFIIRSLADAELYDYPAMHPHETAKLIDQAVDLESLRYEKDRLREILQRARASDASVEGTPEYQRLKLRVAV